MATQEHNENHASRSETNVTLAREIHDTVYQALRTVECTELEDSKYSLKATARQARTLLSMLELVGGFDPDAPEINEEETLTTESEEALDVEPERLTLLEIEDLMADRLRWAHAMVSTVMCDVDVADETTNALSGADNYIREARGYLDQVERWRREHCPETRERDLTSGEQREAEKQELVQRLLKLPRKDMQDVIFCHGWLFDADDDRKAEAFALMERGRSLDSIGSYLYLKEKGDVQMVPETPAG